MQNMTDSEIDNMWHSDPYVAACIPESARALYEEVKRCRAEIAAYEKSMVGMVIVPQAEYLRLLRLDAQMDAMAARERGEL